MNNTPKETAWWIEEFDERFDWLRMYLDSPNSDFEGSSKAVLHDLKRFIATIIEKERAEMQQKIDELQELLLEANESIELLSE